ncbi:glycoside hydrolase family 26 protein [Niabella insulamsoli]|uniref:glycoside hydrolase family 26 protein n=1 Tax=Niabella insulamsoli TaxID=3144874 RepID=UPI0031FD1A51
MLKKNTLLKLLYGLILASFTILQLNGQVAPSDKNATKEAKWLFENMYRLMDKGYLVGHQDDLAYGVHWKYEKGRSDVKDVTGDYPGLYGWELGNLELGREKNLDDVPFDKMRSYIQGAYAKGGVVTISWHANNPLTGKNAWDPAPGSVAAILPGGEKHDLYKTYLNRVAAFMHSLKGKKGEPIPLLWRPFHEHTGGWFWWGVKSCSDDEYKKLFRFSADYLRNEKGLHQLLIGYNTGSEFTDEATFLRRYPGDAYVDFISFDTYQHSKENIDSTFINIVDSRLRVLCDIAGKRHKIPAVGEIGFNQIPYEHWFTRVLAPVFKKHRFSYVLFWRNAGYKPYSQETEFFLPYKNHSSAADFYEFFKKPETLFEEEVIKAKLYQ